MQGIAVSGPWFAVGDTVELDFGSALLRPSVVTGVVIEIYTRFGYVPGTRERIEPLITYRTESGDVKTADRSFVTRVLARGTGQARRYNWACEELQRLRRIASLPWPGSVSSRPKFNVDTKGTHITRPRRGVLEGRLPELALFILADTPRGPVRPIDPLRLAELFFKTRPGFLGGYHPYEIIVREKPFRKWLLGNVDRIMYTVKQLNTYATEELEDAHRQMEADLLMDLDDRYDSEYDGYYDSVYDRDDQYDSFGYLV